MVVTLVIAIVKLRLAPWTKQSRQVRYDYIDHYSYIDHYTQKHYNKTATLQESNSASNRLIRYN